MPRLALCWALSCWVVTLFAADGQDWQHCRAIADAGERLACYDAVATSPADGGAAIASVPAAVVSPARISPAGTPPASAPAPSALTASAAADSFGQESLPRKSTGADPEMPRNLQSRVASVQKSPSGKLIVGLDNGQTWAQIDSPSLKLKTGDEVVIRHGSLGSYLLARVAGGPEIRVRRSQ